MEDSGRSDGQEIPLPFMEPEGMLTCSHKILTLVPNLSQMNHVHSLTPHVFKTPFNTFLPAIPQPHMWPVPFKFLTKILYEFLIPMCAMHPAHLSSTILISTWKPSEMSFVKQTAGMKAVASYATAVI
jgi:hypothetical protein